MLKQLQKIAAIATSASPHDADVVAACDLIAGALGAKEAYVIRAGDPHFVRIGSHLSPTEYGIKQRGLWLIWQGLARQPESAAASAQVSERLVLEGVPLAEGSSGNYIAAIIPGDESNSEMLIIERGKSTPVDPNEVALVEAVRPILCQLLAKVLDAERQDRQQRQLSSLADVARAFNNAHDLDSPLTDLATAIAKATGFDWVTVYSYDETLQNILDSGANIARHANTETAAMARDGRVRQLSGTTDVAAFRSRMRSGAPILVPDVFAAEAKTPPDLLSYYERAHILSIAWFPLLFQDTMLGSINLSSSTLRPFDDAEVVFLTDLATQAATAVKGMRLYRDLERSKQEILEYAEKLAEASQAEHFLARTDALTGIPNRRYLEEVLRAECARAARYREPVSVVMADLDHFKDINDSFGHPVGDEALRLVARVARECARASDFLGRWGGDEFLFILPHTEADDGQTFANRFRTQLAATPFRPEGSDHAKYIRVSAGVADAVPPGKDDAGLLVTWADKALYDAKEGGRDQVRLWRPKAEAA